MMYLKLHSLLFFLIHYVKEKEVEKKTKK